MDHFQEIFTPPDSPAPDYDPRENILNQIRQMEQMEDGDRRDAWARLEQDSLSTNFKLWTSKKVLLVDKYLQYHPQSTQQWIKIQLMYK